MKRPVPVLLFTTAMILSLSACDSILKRPSRVDGKLVLNGLESPDIDGVSATMLKSAKEAEDAGDYRRASQIYRQLMDSEQKEDDATFVIGYAENLRRSGETDKALNAYDNALILEPSSIEAKEGRGLALMDKGEFDKAGDMFSQVMKKDAKRWKTLNALGLLFVIKNMNDEGQAYFAESLRHSANNASILNNIGLTYAIQGKTPEAVQTLQKAGELAGTPRVSQHVDMNLALVYAVSGDLPNAQRIASKYLKGAALDNNMGFYAHLANDDALAKSYLNMALTRSPQYYQRAWDNLKDIEKTSRGSSVSPRTGSAGKNVLR